MKTLLICHAGDDLIEQGIARWLASFSHLTGIVVLHERKKWLFRRMRREIERSGFLGFMDVLAFRAYYAMALARRDDRWKQKELERLSRNYPALDPGIEKLHTHSPNTKSAERFIAYKSPDIMVAFCKILIKERIFSLPAKGTFVMHPGICPEYRNAHGCFWALANDDFDKVGMTLLRIDRGVDTGPIFGYYSYDYDEVGESHFVIQNRVILENLDELREKLIEIEKGEARPIEVTGRNSGAWGQPWLSSYLRWKRMAKKRRG